MAGAAHTTTDHDTIRSWAEERKGKPVAVKGTGSRDDPGVLRIDFPGGSGEESFEEISWEEWFKKFEQNDLAFLYQEEKKSGEESTFFKLVSRGAAKES